MSPRTLALLVALDAFFIALHVLFGERYDVFNLDRERTPAALWSALQLVGTAYALLVIFFSSGRESIRRLWACASVAFTLLSFDEISELHENAAYYLVKYFPPFPFLRSGTPMWIIFLSPLIIAMLFMLALIIRALFRFRRSLGWFASAGVLLFALALTLEFLGGIRSFQSILPFFVVVEEGAELLAASLLLFSVGSFARGSFSSTYQMRKKPDLL